MTDLTSAPAFEAARAAAPRGDDEDMDGEGVMQRAMSAAGAKTVVDANVDLQPLEKAVAEYRVAAAKITAEVQSLSNGTATVQAVDLNDRLALAERRFLSSAGLPGRKWFKHTLQAPGLHTGYAAQAWPGVAQAISDGDWTTAEEQVKVAAACTSAAAAFLLNGA
jgi:N-acetylated-alpha-linked acidic dipeptidase